ncbi:hypothetical protein N9Q20_02885 [Amylibacter sp.]|nr:hypothetical protein [Amylibacter sp.]
MTEQTTYYQPTKLDYLYDAATSIDDEVKLAQIINKMMPYQIRAVYDKFEDPYSRFNYDQEYSNYFWSRFKKAVAEIKPDVILM